jgi:23S rRNA (pseudouridine1915-N3)-methyltransferase
MIVKIITVGGKNNHEIASLITTYEKRYPKHISIQWHYIKHGPAQDALASKQQESESIIKALPLNGPVILLDERGKSLNNESLAEKIFSDSTDISIVIGGAHGVNHDVMKRATFAWSLSDLVFPHQLVRLILAEQLYRSYTISIGHPYHHS